MMRDRPISGTTTLPLDYCDYRQPLYDPLTNLSNRPRLMQALTQRCQSGEVALITISLDNFRFVNYSFGYDAGDLVLQSVAQRLQRCLLPGQLLARLAGDEFALLLPGAAVERSRQMAESLLQAMQQPFSVGDAPLKLTISVGIARFPADADGPAELLTRSHQANRLRKSLGKNGYTLYSQQMLQQYQHKLALKQALSRAIEQRELDVFFQPIINLHTKQLEKCEALLRWQHQGQQIAPLDFIPVAEEFGLARELGNYVWERTCEQLELFSQNGLQHLKIAVNRSMAEFADHSYCSRDWMQMLENKNLDRRNISFEITETLLAPDNKNFTDYLAELKRGGCSISVDDFGTGYSSLSYLRNFPVDYLKIDRSFIHDLGHSEEAANLVSSIVTLARSLNIQTIAEGVETLPQLHRLQAMGCDFIQGFLFSRPIHSAALLDFCRDFQFDSAVAA